MDQNYKHFPHPVLSYDRDDYTQSTFRVDLEMAHIGDRLGFKFTSVLENEAIESLIESGQAKIIFRIESQQTMYREVFEGKVGVAVFDVNESLVKGDISIESYILVAEEIPNFRSEQFHPDYGDLGFDLSRGSILAIGEDFKRRINKDIEELYNIPSIFLISRLDEKNAEMEIRLEGDKISIILCNEDYVKQENLMGLPEYQPILHTMLIMPALIYLFTDLKDLPEDRFDDLSEKRWFKAIDGTLRKMGLALDKTCIDLETPYKLAQLVLRNPLNRGLNALNELRVLSVLSDDGGED